MRSMPEMVDLMHPDPDKQAGRCDAARYRAMKKALLRVIPRRGDGVPFGELVDLVRPHLPAAPFEGASVSWYVTTVKLDLEARGLIERVPQARPQRIRRAKGVRG